MKSSASVLAGVYAVMVAVTVVEPSGRLPSLVVVRVTEAMERAGADPALADPSRVEFLLNVLMVVPLAAFGAWHWAGIDWKDMTAWTFVGSSLVEVSQAIVVDNRSATFIDVCANTSGGLLGALLVSGGRVLIRVRHANAAQSAP